MKLTSYLLKTYAFYTRSRVQKARSSRSAVPYSAKIYASYTRSTAYKKQGAPDQRSLTQQKFMFFTRVTPCTKSKGFLIDGPLLRKTYAFYTRSTAYKKQGALDRRSLTQQIFMHFTHVAPRIKSEGLPIDGLLLSKKLCFLHM
jgi:hypothetical protein